MAPEIYVDRSGTFTFLETLTNETKEFERMAVNDPRRTNIFPQYMVEYWNRGMQSASQLKRNCTYLAGMCSLNLGIKLLSSLHEQKIENDK